MLLPLHAYVAMLKFSRSCVALQSAFLSNLCLLLTLTNDLHLPSQQDRSFASDEDDLEEVTDEQRQEKRLDEKNISVQLMVRGDAINFPVCERVS